MEQLLVDRFVALWHLVRWPLIAVGWIITLVSFGLDLRDVQELGVPWPWWWVTANLVAWFAYFVWNLELRLEVKRFGRQIQEIEASALELLEQDRRRAARPWYKRLLGRD